MPAPEWEDLGVFLDPGEFAVEAMLYPESGAARGPVFVIFEDPFRGAQVNGFDLETVGPHAEGSMKDLAILKRGDEIEIAAVRYVLEAGPQDDGTGWAQIRLYRADGS